MEDWLKTIFSGIGGSIITFVLGLLVGGGAAHGIEVSRKRIRVGDKGRLAIDNDADVDMTDASGKGMKAALCNKGGKIKM